MVEFQASESVQMIPICRESGNGRSTRRSPYGELFLKMLMNPGLSVQRAQASLDMPCAVITDCKALYDTIRRENIQTSLDKRVAIDCWLFVTCSNKFEPILGG